ncbi:MAG: DUF4956 domain-containing protein [Bacteroidetes bacterium]|nr:DUF4956 domain-containing protein [Bacteroidota bacterium]
MEFIEVPLFDEDLFKMLFRFGINMFFVGVLVRYFYYRRSHNRNFMFTYIMISVVVFFICFTLKKLELELGMALGLFAIFGIVRYRTDAIPIKEMTYLFIVIGISVINSLSNKKMSYSELMFANLAILAGVAMLESFWSKKSESRKLVVLEEIELIKPENYDALKQNLEERTGLKLTRVVVGDVDFLKDTAQVEIFYHTHGQVGTLGEALKAKL